LRLKNQEADVFINGRLYPLSAPRRLSEVLTDAGYQLRLVAVMRAGEIIPHEAWAQTMIQDSDELEVVSFVGGG
jgi:thiamine biosynthesis protein ThiS